MSIEIWNNELRPQGSMNQEVYGSRWWVLWYFPFVDIRQWNHPQDKWSYVCYGCLCSPFGKASCAQMHRYQLSAIFLDLLLGTDFVKKSHVGSCRRVVWEVCRKWSCTFCKCHDFYSYVSTCSSVYVYSIIFVIYGKGVNRQ